MSVTAQQQIRLDNFKAQYNSILSNIKVANDELQDILIEGDRAKLGIRKVFKDLEILNSKFLDVQKQKTEIELNLNRRELKLREKEVLMVKKEKSSIDNIKDMLSEAKKEKKEIDQDISGTKDILNNLGIQKIELEKEVSNLSIDFKSLEKIVKGLSEEKIKIQNHKAKIEKESIEINEQLRKSCVASKSELKELKGLIAKEQVKVGLADKALTLREKEIDRREKDIRILTKRLRDLYQQIRPGISLKI